MQARLLCLTLTLTVCLHSFGDTEEPIINIYNWADYIEPSILDDFETEYGIHVNYDIYDSSEMVDTKLMTGSSGYDVIFHAASFASRLIPIGIFQPARFDQFENFHYIDEGIIEVIRANFSKDLTGVPYMWGTTGFTYNVDMIRERMPDAPVHSSAMLFDPKIISRFADCGVSFLDDPISVIPMAMLYLGHPANSVEPAHLAEVEQLVKAVRPYVKYFSSTKFLLDLPSEEVCVAMNWSGDYSVARTRAADAGLDLNLAYTIPAEGATSWFDLILIPADAPHPGNANLFLDFMMRPEQIAKATNYTGYGNVNTGATALVDPEIANDVAIYPDKETIKRLHPPKILQPKLERRRSRTWTKIKTGL